MKQGFQGGKIMGPKPRISLEDNGKVLALSKEGYSHLLIAVHVGCSQRSVCDILKKKTDRKCEKPQDSRTKEKDNEERRQNHGRKKHV